MNDEPMSGVLERNIQTLIDHSRKRQTKRTLELRIADAITRFCGSMRFVYVHLVIYGAWIEINLPWTPLPKFDPSFVVLAMAASVEAIFLSTFILITQNRMTQVAEQRADLDLQITLLTEHELTKLITLVKEIAEKMEIPAAHNPELSELQKDVNPERVLDAIEQRSDPA